MGTSKEKPEGAAASPFLVKDSALVALATGRRAQDLRELRDHLAGVEPSSLHYHFWGNRLRPSFDDPEFNNDFAAWARHGLHDHLLAERLGVLDPTDYGSPELLREELLEICEQRLDELPRLQVTERGAAFYFQRGQLVVFDTHLRAESPQELYAVLPELSAGSIYYHMIEARQREPLRINDFAVWLQGLGAPFARLAEETAGVEPYFASLPELRQRVLAVFERHLHHRRREDD